MKRKGLLISGIILSILYSLALIYGLVVALAGIAYSFASSLQTLLEILHPLLDPFISADNNVSFFGIGCLVALCIFYIILSTRLSKYSHLPNEKYSRKKALVIFYIVCMIIAVSGFAYILITNLAKPFNDNLVINIVTIVFIVANLLGVILTLINVPKEQVVETKQEDKIVATVEQPEQQSQPEQPAPSRPAIYTAQLDDEQPKYTELEQTLSVNQTEQHVEKPDNKSENDKKLIESIAKLDKMRKEGSISPQEYTRLRTNLIKNFVK